MRNDEFNELFKRYTRHCLFLAEQEIGKAANRREFLMEQYVTQLTETVNMSRDPYRGHLVTLLKQGFQQSLPLSTILEEMEQYRLEFLSVLKTTPGMEVQLLFDEAAYEEGYKPKLRSALEFLVRVSITRYIKQRLRQLYPLALAGDDTPDELAIFNVWDDIGKAQPEATKEEPTKERRVEYPEEMSAEEAAEYLNLKSVESLYQLTSAKKIPHYKRGRKLVFKQSELRSWRVEKVASRDEMEMESANRLIRPKGRK